MKLAFGDNFCLCCVAFGMRCRGRWEFRRGANSLTGVFSDSAVSGLT